MNSENAESEEAESEDNNSHPTEEGEEK